MPTRADRDPSAREWAVDSPTSGTGLRPRPSDDPLRPAAPPLSENPVAVALSGGGFRATLAAAGALRLIADIGRLGDLGYLSSVSGGSIANAMTARAWPDLRRRSFSSVAFDASVVEPLVQQVSRHSLKLALIKNAWRTWGPTTRTELLARLFDDWFFEEIELERLDPGVRWIFNAANLTTGVRFGFERDVLGDYTIGRARTAGTGIRLSMAVAASAAVPGTFAPVVVKAVQFPSASMPPVLLDGGVYDNTGLEALDSDSYQQAFLFALNAGGLLHAGGYGRVPIVKELARANSLLYRQSTTLRTREMVNQFRRAQETSPGEALPTGARRGVLAALATDFPDRDRGSLRDWFAAHAEHRSWDGEDLARVPTVFDKLDERLCRRLVYRGWWLMGAALACHHPDLLPDDVEAPPL